MKSNFFIFIILMLFGINTYAQIDSRYGREFPAKDTIRVFLVFAEALNDPLYDNEHSNWPAEEMPTQADNWFEANTDNGIQSYLTKYFYQASHGELVVLGDYLDLAQDYPNEGKNLVQIEADDIDLGYHGLYHVIDYLNYIADEYTDGDLITHNGYHINADFDDWTDKSFGEQSIKQPDGNIELIMVVWRVNSKLSTGNGGYIYFLLDEEPLADKYVNYHSNMRLDHGSPTNVARHELSHLFLGPNEFHTVGNNAGVKKIMPTLGGWSMLSGWSNRGEVYNAFDRWRLGWMAADTPYEISAINPASGNPVDADLIYGEAFPEGTQEFILRDFASTGDALRIKLPYIKSINSEVLDQYIWLENHQNASGYYDLRRNPNWASNEGKGIYAYIQLGKDIRIGTYNEVYKETTQYIYPLNAFGMYDANYENIEIGEGKRLEEYASPEEWLSRGATTSDLVIDTNMENPFTGYHLLMEHPYNYNDPDIINDVPYYNTITRSETIWVDKVIVDGVEMPQSDFVSTSNTQPIWGTKYDVFEIGRHIGVGTNPPSTPIYTYETVYDEPNIDARYYDNRHIFLNGLDIEILEQLGDGSIKVRVSYDHYDVAEDTRWCGNIVLNEQVNLLEGYYNIRNWHT